MTPSWKTNTSLPKMGNAQTEVMDGAEHRAGKPPGGYPKDRRGKSEGT